MKNVKISKKLTSSPACLAAAVGAMDIRMERFLIEQKQLPSSTAKILEINPNHPIIKHIENSLGNDDKKGEMQDLVYLIFDQSCIIENEPLVDNAGFAKRMNKMIEQKMLL